MEELRRKGEELKDEFENATTISGKESAIQKILTNNQKQEENLAIQISEYNRQIQDIKDSYANDGIEGNDMDYVTDSKYVELIGLLFDATHQTDDLVKSTMNYYNILKQLPTDKIAQNIERNNAAISAEESKRALKQARGETITRSDYTTELNKLQNNVNMKQSAYNKAEKDLADARAAYGESGTAAALEEVNKAQTAFYEAEAALNSAQTEFIKTEKESIEASLNVHNEFIRELDARKAELESQRNLAEASG